MTILYPCTVRKAEFHTAIQSKSVHYIQSLNGKINTITIVIQL